MKVKVLTSDNADGLENRIEEWIANHPDITIAHTNFAAHADSYTYVILYKPPVDDRPHRMRRVN